MHKTKSFVGSVYVPIDTSITCKSTSSLQSAAVSAINYAANWSQQNLRAVDKFTAVFPFFSHNKPLCQTRKSFVTLSSIQSVLFPLARTIPDAEKLLAFACCADFDS